MRVSVKMCFFIQHTYLFYVFKMHSVFRIHVPCSLAATRALFINLSQFIQNVYVCVYVIIYVVINKHNKNRLLSITARLMITLIFIILMLNITFAAVPTAQQLIILFLLILVLLLVNALFSINRVFVFFYCISYGVEV